MLRVKDYEIQWGHLNHFSATLRLAISFIKGVDYQMPYKGHSTCYIFKKDSNGGLLELLGIGEARCSLSDNFSYETGRKLSLSRALKRITLPKKERTMIWEAYRRMGMPEGKTRW